MLYLRSALVFLSLSSAAASSRPPREPETPFRPEQGCAVEGAKTCSASPAVSGYDGDFEPTFGSANHIVLTSGHVRDRDRHRGKLDEYDRRRLSEPTHTLFEHECDVAGMDTAGWFHFSTKFHPKRSGQGKTMFRFTLDNMFVTRDRADLAQFALWGPYDSHEEMEHDCGWDHDDKLAACSQSKTTVSPGPPLVKGTLDHEWNNLKQGAKWKGEGATFLEADKHYALMIGSSYDAKEVRLSYTLGIATGPQLTLHIEKTHTWEGCAWCDQFWDGASTANLGQPVCVKTQRYTDFHPGVPGRMPYDYNGENAYHPLEPNHEVFVKRKNTLYGLREIDDQNDGDFRRRLTSVVDGEYQHTVNVTECRPPKLPEGVDPSNVFHKNSHVHTVQDLDRVLHAIGAPPCPKDHVLKLADHFEEPIPPCECDHYPEAHGSIDWIHSREGHTMCMKVTHKPEENTRMMHAADDFETSCYEPHPEYPHVGVEDGGKLTEEGCRSDMLPCIQTGIGRRPLRYELDNRK